MLIYFFLVHRQSTCGRRGAKWRVDDVVSWVAQHTAPRFNALIDTGALITGLNNEEEARKLLEVGGPRSGLGAIQVCVFFDDDGGQWFVDRSGAAAMPLSRCGIALERRFVFYDQSHCTGTDCKHRLDAVAAVTLGKDMVFRDHVQGCWRMRGLEHGQSLVVLLVDEVVELVRSAAAAPLPAAAGAAAAAEPLPPLLADVATAAATAEGQQALLEAIISWLIVKALETEETQHIQLMKQGLRDVWRRTALHELLDSSAPADCEYSAGGPLLLTRCNSTVADVAAFEAALAAQQEADAVLAAVAWQFMADEGWADFDGETGAVVECAFVAFNESGGEVRAQHPPHPVTSA